MRPSTSSSRREASRLSIGTQMLLSGIADDRVAQKKSLAWIRAQSRERNCVACIANHDFDVKPGAITL